MTKHKPVPKEKIKGTIYVMPKEFLLNLRDGRYAKVAIALDLAPGQSDGASADGARRASGENAVGTLPEEPMVREIVTNVITNQDGATARQPTAGAAAIRRRSLPRSGSRRT